MERSGVTASLVVVDTAAAPSAASRNQSRRPDRSIMALLPDLPARRVPPSARTDATPMHALEVPLTIRWAFSFGSPAPQLLERRSASLKHRAEGLNRALPVFALK